ncbi:uncharacterized protein LOC115713798 [Cannabis sativa]|uniref:uncharacterized protein LOC115713798 n=1 Tax=Cannabis sativa TaxID=3483 RepID=UPI0029C9EFA1|nr:uncharacterized protein LOC115713798 [Cannabis sativa]
MYEVNVQFQVKIGIPPMKIKDDNSCKFYQQLRIKNDDETTYPLMVNFKELSTCTRIEQATTNFDTCSRSYIDINYIHGNYFGSNLELTEKNTRMASYIEGIADMIVDATEQSDNRELATQCHNFISKAWRAREKAKEHIRGCPQESYADIPAILYMMQQKNPDLVTDEKGRFKGTLLIANAQNANRHIVPLAFAIVDSENDESWQWFFQKLQESYGERDGQCIIFDRYESIAKAAKENFPNLMHGVCCYHLFKNIKSKFRKRGNELKNAFNGASRAYTETEFEEFMRDLDSIDERIKPYLFDEVSIGKWTRIYNSNKRYAIMTNNIAESVNAAIKEIRELPVVKLIECLNSLVQKWYWNNKNRALGIFTNLAKISEETLLQQRKMSLKYKVETSNLIIYLVHDVKKSYVVDMEKKICTCKRFQFDEMPYSHAMAVITKRHGSCYDYCSYYYTQQSFLSTYEETILPLGDPTSWDIPDEIKERIVLPPKHKRPVGRPKKDRYKNIIELQLQIKCGNCNQKDTTNDLARMKQY